MISRIACAIIMLTASLMTHSVKAIESTQQRSIEGLVDASEAVVAVEILDTDYRATAADGPMTATAKVKKSLKGPLKTGDEFRFLESSWVGPNYKKGEYRILFLQKVGSNEQPRAAEWRILARTDARIDYFFDKDSLPELSAESLESFLKSIPDSTYPPKKFVFSKAVKR